MKDLQGRSFVFCSGYSERLAELGRDIEEARLELV
jgi:hypothetical protein